MVELGTSSAFRGWVRVRVLGYGFGGRPRDRKVKSRDCALAIDIVKAAAVDGRCHVMVPFFFRARWKKGLSVIRGP